MSKSKGKKRKKPQAHQQGGYKKYLKDFLAAMRKLEFYNPLEDFDAKATRMMYESRLTIANPEAGNELISSKELARFNKKARSYYREEIHVFGPGKVLSGKQMEMFYNYARTLTRLQESLYESKDHPQVVKSKTTENKAFHIFYENFLLGYFRLITQMSNPDIKYYGLNIRIGKLFKENLELRLIATVYGYPAQKTAVAINGKKRPAFRLGKPMASKILEWLQVDRSLVKKHYRGPAEKLDVYIQSHALKRLSQRLDLLNREAINYTLWENTNNIKSFEYYKGYMLLPVKLHKIKVGYLLAWVVDHKVIFRTFLFITHNSTPEGDRLREASGLCKEEINYWRIDRLSTFVNLDAEAYPLLHELFQKAGMEELFSLKEKAFDVDTMQETNMDDLVDYLQRNKVMEEQK